MIQKVALKQQGVYLNCSGETKSDVQKITTPELASLQKTLTGYGYTLSEDLFNVVTSIDKTTVDTIFSQVFLVLDEVLGDKKYVPFNVKYPEPLNESSLIEDVLQTLHYITGITPEDLGIEQPKKEFNPSSDVTELKELKGFYKKDMVRFAKETLESNVTLSESNLSDLFVILDVLNDKDVLNLLGDVKIVMKETSVKTALYLGSRNLPSPTLKTATDVLRMMAEMSNAPLSSKHILFKRFSRSEVRTVVLNLERIKYIKDDMNTYKKVWKKFFKLFGTKVNLSKYPNVKEAVDYLFGDFHHETMAGKLDNALQTYKASSEMPVKNQMEALNELLNLYKKRGGDFARILITILSDANSVSDYELDEYIINQFFTVVDSVNSRVLYQLLDRAINMKYGRFVKVSGKTVKLEETKQLSPLTIEYLTTKIEEELLLRASKKEPMGLVYIDDSLKKIAMTTSQRNANETLSPMTLGSRIPIEPKAEVLRFFVYWENADLSYTDSCYDADRVDIDLSAVLLDKELDRIGNIAYFEKTRPYNEIISFSGDITTAPDGAIEYIDIPVSKYEELISKGCEYISMVVQSYTQQPFGTFPIRGGVMQLTEKEAKTESLYKPSAVTTVFDLSGKSKTRQMFLIDLKEKELVWLDEDVMTIMSDLTPNNVASLFTFSNSPEYLRYLLEKEPITMYDVIRTNATARGVLLDNLPTEEETLSEVTIFKVDKDNPLNLMKILSDFM